MFTTGAGGYRGGATRRVPDLTMYMFEAMLRALTDSATAAAVAWVLFLIILITAGLNFLIVRRINSDK